MTIKKEIDIVNLAIVATDPIYFLMSTLIIASGQLGY